MNGDTGISKIMSSGDEDEEESAGMAWKDHQTGLWVEETNNQNLRFYI